jgi:CRISPR/Cas system CMR-associated protein Cmr3 (group 5 of RAMP superfamily)
MDVNLLKDQLREFQILRKSEILRKTSKVGRKIGKVLKYGNHSKENTLYDVYYLEERTKSAFMNN